MAASVDPGPAPLVLIAPAMAIGSGYYRPLTAAFADHGWPARALERRGFEPGGVRAGRGVDWSYADETAVITDAVAGARREDPQRPVLVLGHSMGGQLGLAHQLGAEPADGLVTVGTSIPDRRHFPYRGVHLAVLAGAVVPAATALRGHLPAPLFGGPGARTLMRQWARMVRTGCPPFPVDRPVTAPALVVELDDDRLAPQVSVEAFAAAMFEPAALTYWRYRRAEVPAGQSNDHIGWVRTPAPVVARIIDWWQTIGAPAAP